MNVWFIVLITIMTNGDVYTELKVPNDLVYNTRESCVAAGPLFAEMKQGQLGSSGKVVFSCHALSESDIRGALTKKQEI